MALKFQHALYAAGAVLFAIGALYLFLNMPAFAQGEGFLEAISYSFTAVCGAIFSGVMMGVGAALIVDGILQMLPRRLHRVALALFLGLASASAGMLSVAEASAASFSAIVAFISCSAFALCMAVSSSVIGISGYMAKFLSSE